MDTPLKPMWSYFYVQQMDFRDVVFKILHVDYP